MNFNKLIPHTSTLTNGTISSKSLFACTAIRTVTVAAIRVFITDAAVG